jgi:hypothetical protein
MWLHLWRSTWQVVATSVTIRKRTQDCSNQSKTGYSYFRPNWNNEWKRESLIRVGCPLLLRYRPRGSFPWPCACEIKTESFPKYLSAFSHVTHEALLHGTNCIAYMSGVSISHSHGVTVNLHGVSHQNAIILDVCQTWYPYGHDKGLLFSGVWRRVIWYICLPKYSE